MCKKKIYLRRWQIQKGVGNYCSSNCFHLSTRGRVPSEKWFLAQANKKIWNKGIKAKDDARVARFCEAGHAAVRGKPAWNKGLGMGGRSNWLRKNGTWEYRIIHKRITRKFGKEKICEKCGSTNSKIYQWANISGKFMENRDDWKRLCLKCHKEMDEQFKNEKT